MLNGIYEPTFCRCNLATWFYNFYFHDVNLIPKTNIHVDYEFSIRWPRPHNIIMITTWNGDLHNNVWRGDVDDEKMYSCNLKKLSWNIWENDRGDCFHCLHTYNPSIIVFIISSVVPWNSHCKWIQKKANSQQAQIEIISD